MNLIMSLILKNFMIEANVGNLMLVSKNWLAEFRKYHIIFITDRNLPDDQLCVESGLKYGEYLKNLIPQISNSVDHIINKYCFEIEKNIWWSPIFLFDNIAGFLNNELEYQLDINTHISTLSWRFKNEQPIVFKFMVCVLLYLVQLYNIKELLCKADFNIEDILLGNCKFNNKHLNIAHITGGYYHPLLQQISWTQNEISRFTNIPNNISDVCLIM